MTKLDQSYSARYEVVIVLSKKLGLVLDADRGKSVKVTLVLLGMRWVDYLDLDH
jgi:hypothetical protein